MEALTPEQQRRIRSGVTPATAAPIAAPSAGEAQAPITDDELFALGYTREEIPAIRRQWEADANVGSN